jgi:YbgC/YbaW family acyl-CoA thioester hydrolase
MTPRFTRQFRVRHCELNALGQVGPVTLVHYMQEAAIEASTALGFSPDWYRERGVAWVVRRLAVRYLGPASYGDEVAVTTWISSMRGVRSNREYEVTRDPGGAAVARARVEWVYVDARTGQPTLPPEGWAEAFPGRGKAEDLGVRPAGTRPTDGTARHTSRRRARAHEEDAAGHVNHAVYLRWAAEAREDALREAAPGERANGPERPDAVLRGHEVQYSGPAFAGDEVEVVSWVCERGESGETWTHEVSGAGTGKLLARVYAAWEAAGPARPAAALPGRE